MSQRFGQDGNKDNSWQNAIKHCTWMCYVAGKKECTKQTTTELCKAHENNEGNPQTDSSMDLGNNEVGLSLSHDGISMKECADKCMKQLGETGNLRWNEGPNPP